MAETIGLAIGLGAFTQQLTLAIVRLKSFCKDIKNAPTEVQETLHRMNGLAAILERFDKEQDDIATFSADREMFRCSIRLCKQVLERILSLTAELEAAMKTRKFRTSFKTALQREAMDKMLQKLDRSKMDLLIAYSLYSDARQRTHVCSLSQNSAIDNQSTHCTGLKDHRDTLTSQESEENRTVKPEQYELTPALEQPANELQIRLPRWLCEYAWNVAMQKSSGCWKLSLTTFRIVPISHPALRLCRKGDVEGIKSLLERRELSIHDQFESGYSLSSIAAYCGQTKLVYYLLERGANAASLPEFGIASSLRFASSYYMWLTNPEALFHARSHAQVLLQRWDDLDDPCIVTLAKTRSQWTIEDRLSLVDNMVFKLHSKMFWYTIDMGEDGDIDGRLFSRTGRNQSVLLHMIARHWSRELALVHGGSPQLEKVDTSTWIRQVARCARATPNLHAVDGCGLTPFMVFLIGLIRVRKKYGQALVHWVDCLSRAGLDLVEYGNVEKEHMQRAPHCQSLLEHWGVINFTSGPNIEDWRLWFRHPGDIFAGIFWELVENPYCRIPGAWLFEEPEHRYDSFVLSRESRCCGIKARDLRRLKRMLQDAKQKSISSTTEVVWISNLIKIVSSYSKRQKPGIPIGCEGWTEILDALSALEELHDSTWVWTLVLYRSCSRFG